MELDNRLTNSAEITKKHTSLRKQFRLRTSATSKTWSTTSRQHTATHKIHDACQVTLCNHHLLSLHALILVSETGNPHSKRQFSPLPRIPQVSTTRARSPHQVSCLSCDTCCKRHTCWWNACEYRAHSQIKKSSQQSLHNTCYSHRENYIIKRHTPYPSTLHPLHLVLRQLQHFWQQLLRNAETCIGKIASTVQPKKKVATTLPQLLIQAHGESSTLRTTKKTTESSTKKKSHKTAKPWTWTFNKEGLNKISDLACGRRLMSPLSSRCVPSTIRGAETENKN